MCLQLSIREFFKTKRYILLLFIAIAFLVFKGLNFVPLWADEADVVIFGRSILQFGVPKAFDGLNWVHAGHTALQTADTTWIYHPWLPHYLTALCLLLFKGSIPAVKIVFAFLGLCSFFFFYKSAKIISNKSSFVLLFLTLLFLNASFLVYLRQLRYYPLNILFTSILFFCYLSYLKGEKYYLLGGISTVLFFFSNYLSCLSFVFSIVLYHIFILRWGKKV